MSDGNSTKGLSLPTRPDGDDFNRFYPWWLWTGRALNALLGPRVSYLNRGSIERSAIGRLLHRAFVSYGEGEEDGAMDLQVAINLAEDLTELRELDPKLFQDFRKRFTSGQGKNPEWLNGHSFELWTALHLTHRGFEFTCPAGAPDFSVRTEAGTVSVECTVPHVANRGAEDVRKRAHTAIRRKVNLYRRKAAKGQPQDWLEGHSALFLDATYLRRAEWGYESQGEVTKGLDWGIQDALEGAPFGLIVAFWGGHTFEDGQDLRPASCVTAPRFLEDPVLAGFRAQLLEGFEPPGDHLSFRLPRPPG